MRIPFGFWLIAVVVGFGFSALRSVAAQEEAGPPASLTDTFSEIVVDQLRCDGMVDPLGVDSAPPRLSWQLQGTGRSQRQAAWQVRAATSLEALADSTGALWDSGRVEADTQLFIPYAGRPVRSAEKIYWQVRIWDGEGRVSAWSQAASWTAGLLASADWKARWITDPALLSWTRAGEGYRSQTSAPGETEKWIQLDLGAPQRIDRVRLFALRHGEPELLGFPERFKVEVSDDPGFAARKLVADQTQANSQNPHASPIELAGHGAVARYLRFTATQLRRAGGAACLALSQIEVISEGKNVAAGAGATASDSAEGEGWSLRCVVDDLDGSRLNPVANTTRLLRRDFTVKPGLKRALAFVSGLGHYEMAVNGERVGRGLLSPGWTAQEKTRLYDTYDITELLRNGANTVGLVLAGGMYNVQAGRYVKFTTPFRPLMALAQLRFVYDDGSVDEVASDDRWKFAAGPIFFSNVYGGEDYDARLEPAGWSQAGFADQAWSPAVLAPEFKGAMRGASHASPSLIAHESFQPVARKTLRPGVSVYDFGQNAAVMPRLRVRGEAGARVRLVPSELVHQDGRLDRASVAPGGAESYWSYTLAGTGKAEDWFPKFFYHGARYLQVELSPGKSGMLPTVDSLETVVVHSDSAPIGEFSCSNELFNRIHALVRWAQRSNLSHVLTDCPHRERLGWLEQYHLNGPSLRYEFDLARLYAKCFQDMEDAQLPSGLIPDIAPEFVQFGGGFRDSPEWGSAFVLAAWQHYVWTGDEAPLQIHFDAMARYLAYLESRAADGIVSHGLGDWYDLGPKPPGKAQLTPVALTATAIYYEDLRTLARIARQLGKNEAAETYSLKGDAVRQAFNRKFFSNGTGEYATGSQTAQAMPLVLDLPYPDFRDAVLAGLVHAIQARGNAITAGDVGYRYVLRALAQEGRSDLVYAMNNQSEKPGYGYQLAKGCTSLAEAWTANPSSSQNHFMLGQIVEWFYHDLVGLAPDPEQPGFKHVIIRPQLVGGVEWAKASYLSPRGRIAVLWRKAEHRFFLHTELPVNVSAEVWIPTGEGDVVEESGELAVRRPGVRLERQQNGCAVYSVESGAYDFSVRSPER